MVRESLPIDAVLPELLAKLREAGAVVLRAPTGAGKTTRVPPGILDAGLVGAGQILLLEPRRVAARAAARRMADEHGTRLGDLFGYQVRFDRQAGPRTRCLTVTPGILLRYLLDDPFLERISVIVFDEFHERGLETDLALGLVRLLRTTVRPDLKLVVMSATLDVQKIAEYLGQCPTVTSEGRTYPVTVSYRPHRSDDTATAVREALSESVGDVLVFLSGLQEIRRTAEDLKGLSERGMLVLPLHGELPSEQQDRALKKSNQRKIVLATNVAETSVTVYGVTAVVDTGTARYQQFDPSVGMDRLKLGPISKASADQRAGRAGRTQPGICVRLWSELDHRARAEHTIPEIRRVDLAGAMLQLLAFGETDLQKFPWFEPPRPESILQATALLRELGATNSEQLTDLGRRLAELPVHPRIGRLLIEGARLGCAEQAALAAALLSERDPFARDLDRTASNRFPSFSDLLDRVEGMEDFERSGKYATKVGEILRGPAYTTLQARDHLRRMLHQDMAGERAVDSDEAILRAIFAAYPDRLARRRSPGDRRARLVGGRGVRLAPSSGVSEADLFVAVDVDAGGVESFVRIASGVRKEWLSADRLTTRIETTFDDTTLKLIARRQVLYGDLIIEETGSHIADESQAAEVLAAAAAMRWERVRPSPESPAGQFLLRLKCLRGWAPQFELPDFVDERLKDLLPELCRGRRSLEDVRTAPWLDALRGHLSYHQLQTLDREAPERLEVPSGSLIEMQYEEGRPPILAARIQELFGLTETPRIAGGRVKVLLHLLAPNYRPQQVTDDLTSFWQNGYPLVRKELRARYPKHSWPDDPTTAEAIRGPKRRA